MGFKRFAFAGVKEQEFAVQCISDNDAYLSSPSLSSVLQIRDENAYIQIEFTVDNPLGMSLKSINFSAASNAGSEGFFVENYDIRYEKNSEGESTLLSNLSLINTSSTSPYDDRNINIATVNPMFILNDGDTFKIKLYPYNAQVIFEDFVGFYLSGVNNVNGSPLDFTIGAEINSIPITVFTWNMTTGVNDVSLNSLTNFIFTKGSLLGSTHSGSGGGLYWDLVPLRAINNYFPEEINDIDVEIDFSDYTKVNGDLFIFYQGNDFGTDKILLSIIDSQITFSVVNSSVGEQITHETGLSYPFSGNIKVKGDGASVNLLWNDVIVDNLSFTNQHTATENPLSFNAQYFVSGDVLYVLHQDITFKKIKIQSIIWDFLEGIGNTTIDSNGGVTSLFTNALRNENAFIQVEFTVNNPSGMTINGINYSAASNFAFEGAKVNKYDLAYQINNNSQVDLLTSVDLNGTTGVSPYDTKNLTPNISLNDGDAFKLKFYPYDAQSIFAGFVGFYLADIINPNGGIDFTINADVNASPETILLWELNPDINADFVLHPSAISFSYSKGSVLGVELQNQNNGVLWDLVPMADFNIMWIEL